MIQRAVGAGAFVQIGQVGANVKAFTDPAVSPGVTYSYRVAAFNTSAQSGWSNTATATYPSLPAAPTITSAIAARTSATTERITVNWASVLGRHWLHRPVELDQYVRNDRRKRHGGQRDDCSTRESRHPDLVRPDVRDEPRGAVAAVHSQDCGSGTVAFRDPAVRRGLRAPPRVSENVAFLGTYFSVNAFRACPDVARAKCGDDIPMSAPSRGLRRRKALRQVARRHG